MKTILFIGLSALLIGTVGASLLAAAEKSGSTGDEPAPILVEADELLGKLGEENLRILDVRSQDEYAKGHIPGAVRVDVGEWKSLAIEENGLRDAKRWAEKVGSMGITKEAHVVVYGGGTSNTARIWWLLKYVGVKNASILNGGWEWWAKRDGAVEKSAPQVNAAEFKPDFQADRLAEIDSVKQSLNSKNVKVVDARSDGEFEDGRIPDSVHLEWKHLLAEDGRFKTPEQLKELFRNHGILPSETAVCY